MIVKKIKVGYKKTDIGIIPEDWDVCEIQNSYDICNNLRRPISEDERKKIQGKYPYYGPTRIQDNINEYRLDGEYSLIGEDGDHFLKWSTMPMTLLAIGKFNVNNHAHVIKGNKNETKWFYWYFNHRDLTPFLSRQGAGRYKLNKATLKIIKLAVPPIKEQQRIVEYLENINDFIISLNKLIDKKKKIKQGTMQQLLTGKKRLLGFCGEWNNFILNDLIYIQGGYSFKSDYFTKTGVPIIRISNIQNAVIDINDVVYYKDYSISKNFCVNQGDVLIAMSGATTGKVGIYKNEIKAYLNQRVGKVVIKDNNKAYLPYISQLFQTNIFQLALEKSISQGAQPNISGYQIEALSFFMPISIEEQKRIAEILADIDSEIEALEQKLEKYKKIKQGMMQELLTGRIRLI